MLRIGVLLCTFGAAIATNSTSTTEDSRWVRATLMVTGISLSSFQLGNLEQTFVETLADRLAQPVGAVEVGEISGNGANMVVIPVTITVDSPSAAMSISTALMHIVPNQSFSVSFNTAAASRGHAIDVRCELSSPPVIQDHAAVIDETHEDSKKTSRTVFLLVFFGSILVCCCCCLMLGLFYSRWTPEDTEGTVTNFDELEERDSEHEAEGAAADDA